MMIIFTGQLLHPSSSYGISSLHNTNSAQGKTEFFETNYNNDMNTKLSLSRLANATLALFVLATAIACSDSQISTNPSAGSTEQINNDVVLPLPAGLAQIRTINTNNLYAQLQIGDNTPENFQQNTPVSIKLRVNRGDTLLLNIKWFEKIEGATSADDYELLLASYTLDQVVNGPITLDFDSDNYITKGVGFDDDSDGLSNLAERRADSNPLDQDTDNDGINDGDEIDIITDPLDNTDDLSSDTDGDRLSDGQEVDLGTNPTLADTDNDGLEDSLELTLGTNPRVPDSDNDGLTDSQEVNQLHTNPLDAQSPTPLPDSPNVRINSISPSKAPLIDGQYDRSYSNATFTDTNGLQLDIDNLMIDKGAVNPDGDTDFRWFAMHDKTFLYVFILGENVAEANPIRDSPTASDDDSIEIYIDGDNSKRRTYDALDDRHIIIPLLAKSDDTTSSNTTVSERGSHSVSLPEIQFATCVCTGGTQQTWEVRIPLEEFGIVVDRPFGFEVQLNIDNDTGTRDAKWGWFHPSRFNQDVDNTQVNPSYMGSAVLSN